MTISSVIISIVVIMHMIILRPISSVCITGTVPDRDDHLHPGWDWAGMTLNLAGTGMISKTRPGPGPGSGSSQPGYPDSNRDLTHFLMLYVPLDVHVN